MSGSLFVDRPGFKPAKTLWGTDLPQRDFSEHWRSQDGWHRIGCQPRKSERPRAKAPSNVLLYHRDQVELEKAPADPVQCISSDWNTFDGWCHHGCTIRKGARHRARTSSGICLFHIDQVEVVQTSTRGEPMGSTGGDAGDGCGRSMFDDEPDMPEGDFFGNYHGDH